MRIVSKNKVRLANSFKGLCYNSTRLRRSSKGVTRIDCFSTSYEYNPELHPIDSIVKAFEKIGCEVEVAHGATPRSTVFFTVKYRVDEPRKPKKPSRANQLAQKLRELGEKHKLLVGNYYNDRYKNNKDGYTRRLKFNSLYDPYTALLRTLNAEDSQTLDMTTKKKLKALVRDFEQCGILKPNERLETREYGYTYHGNRISDILIYIKEGRK